MLLALVILGRVENKTEKARRDQIVEGLECQTMPNHSRITAVLGWGGDVFFWFVF